MKNQIIAKVEFSFKGEIYSPSAIIDLDQTMKQQDLLPSIHLMIARENKIDTYSYLYEVMEQAEIFFDSAQGIATQFVSDNRFDFAAFQDAWRETRLETMWQEIVTTEMGLETLDQHAGLRNALIKAYELGKKDAV